MENKDELVDNLVCVGCLCVGRKLQKITNEKLRNYYLDALKEIPLCNMPQDCPDVCWECTIMLKKAVSFREQVKDSYKILQMYANENLHEYLLMNVARQPRLGIHTIQNFNLETNPLTPANEEVVFQDVQIVPVKSEVKIEAQDQEDDTTHLDDNHPLSDYSDKLQETEIEIVKLMRKKVKKKRKKPDQKLKKAKKVSKKSQDDTSKNQKAEREQRILTVELTFDEMIVEREKESQRESYLRAPYKCESCLVGFSYVRSHKQHLKTKHAPELGDYSCPICKVVVASVDSFTAHYKRHLRRYECAICHKRTTDAKVMEQHYYSTHEISLKEYKCHICEKVSNSIDTHRYHMDSHKARVQCPECDKTFSHRAGLMNHRISVHECRNEFPCTFCGKVFRWQTSLKRHVESHEPKKNKGSQAYCSPCGVSFTSVSSYQRHLKNSLKHVSQDDLRFICDHCNRRFADKTKLRDHIEEKHLHRTYQCGICLKPSKNRVGLDQHIRNVHVGRPNNKICHHCGKGFPTKVQLESHIRTHTGERPFICEFCPTTFSQQSNLYKHNRQVHLNIKAKKYPISKKHKNQLQTEQAVEIPQDLYV